MKAVILRLATYLSIFIMTLFIGVFVWANWRPLSPGERADFVNFVQYDVRGIPDSATVSAIAQSVRKLDGVRVAAYNKTSNILSVGYAINDTEQAQIEAAVRTHFSLQLQEKVFGKTGPRCPVGGSLTLLTRVRRLLCVRD